MKRLSALTLLVIACGTREAAAPSPVRVTDAAEATAPAAATVAEADARRSPTRTTWAPACAEAIRNATEPLRAQGYLFPYSDIVSCPSPQRAMSAPKYVHASCEDPGVDASFQGPRDPEHIYVTIEELGATHPTPLHRGMMPWARERANESWTELDVQHTRHLFRKSSDRIVLIRLIMEGRPTKKAQAFMEALRGAADECLE